MEVAAVPMQHQHLGAVDGKKVRKKVSTVAHTKRRRMMMEHKNAFVISKLL